MTDTQTKTPHEIFIEKQKVCFHDGGFSMPAQGMVVTQGEIIVINTVSCVKCGHMFTNTNVLPLARPNVSDISIPKMGGFKV